MSNAIVDLRFTLDVPEDRLEKLVGREDDGSQAWYEAAWEAVEEAVKDDPSGYLGQYVLSEPEVEVTM